MTTLPILLASLAFALLTAAGPSTQVPEYTVEVLGPGTVINDMNLSGDVVGWVSSGGVQAFLVGPGRPPELLPLPPGYASAWAQGINDAGVVVGSAATGSFPEFGQAVAWYPDGAGGWDIVFLGQLPGQSQSVAYDVNNRGDIIGVSISPGFGGGPTVWFNSPSGVMNLSALGAPSSPKEINDEGVIVGISGGLFDIDTLTATPLPPFTGNQNSFQGWAINDAGELAGTGFYGGTSRSATTWTTNDGWESVSGLFNISALVQAFDINASRVTVLEAPAPSVHFDGFGTFTLGSVLSPSQPGQWVFVQNLGLAVNDAGQIAAIAFDNASGDGGVVLMTPVDASPPFVDLGQGLAGTLGVPGLSGSGTPVAGSDVTLDLTDARPSSTSWLVLGTGVLGAAFKGGTLVPTPDVVVAGLPVDGGGSLVITEAWPSGLPSGFVVVAQHWIADPVGPAGFAASNGLSVTQP